MTLTAHTSPLLDLARISLSAPLLLALACGDGEPSESGSSAAAGSVSWGSAGSAGWTTTTTGGDEELTVTGSGTSGTTAADTVATGTSMTDAGGTESSSTESTGTTGATGATGSTGSTSDSGGGTGEPLEPVCTTMVLSEAQVITQGDPQILLEVPMEEGVPYRSLRVDLEVTPSDWGGQCYNPYYKPPKSVPVFHRLLTLQRGAHWCKGGNLASLTLRGPGSNRLIAQTHYKETVWQGGGCGPSVEPHVIFPEKTVAVPEGETRALRLHYDADQETIEVSVGEQSFSGASKPGAQLLATEGAPLYLAISRDLWLECYDSEGNEDEEATCCHPPSIGWGYGPITVELCV